ncbi:MAG: metallophosphoesterase family protein [Armatimonadetes bacterium]|nr:metallophosphoesterase family protein [Armatimonadota bacterium]
MRLAVLSDIHANLEALEAVLAHLEAQSHDALVCLGDFVGYGPDPNECIDRLKGQLRAAVVGNHDLAAIGARPIDDFNLFAQEAVLWTRQVLTNTSRDYLAALPERADVEGLLLVHGSPRMPAEEYILDTRTARASFVADGFRIALVGHTHQPALFIERNHRVSARGLLPEVSVPLPPSHRYIVNVGSVGQPRDGDPRASYAIVETEAPSVTLHRVPYPYTQTQGKMQAAGLPVLLGERLALGR